MEVLLNKKEWKEATKPRLIGRFEKKIFQLHLYVASLLSLLIYPNTILMKTADLLFRSPSYDYSLGKIHLSDSVRVKYSRVGQEIAYTFPDEKNPVCTVSFDDSHIYVVFRGTTTVTEALKDADIKSRTVYESSCQHKTAAVCRTTKNFIGRKCLWSKSVCSDPDGSLESHRGFLGHLEHIEGMANGPAEMKDETRLLSALATEKEHCSKRIVITGHSLGGSTAVLFSIKLALLSRPLAKRVQYIFLYGCPAIGNQYVERFVRHVYRGKCFNCVYKSDWVPYMISPFYAVGTNVVLSDSMDSLEKEEKNLLEKDSTSILKRLATMSILYHSMHYYIWAVYNGFFKVMPKKVGKALTMKSGAKTKKTDTTQKKQWKGTLNRAK